jgi:hypothetical protein
VAEKGQPRRPTITGIWLVMSGKDTPHHIFIDFDAECLVDLLRDPWAAKPWLRCFSSTMAWISSGDGPLGPVFDYCQMNTAVGTFAV